MRGDDDILKGLRDPQLDLAGLLGGLFMDIKRILGHPGLPPEAKLAGIASMMDERAPWLTS